MMLPESNLKLLEFHKLQKMLEENGIPFEKEALITGEHIMIPDAKTWRDENNPDPKRISIICCTGSYGYERGLIEIWAPDGGNDPAGYLNAEEGFAMIKKVLEK